MDGLSTFRGRRCLVTGAYGFIGAALTRFLSQAEAEIFKPSRVELDVADAVAVDAYVRKCAPEFVFHLASEGVSRTVPLEKLLRSNVRGACNLVSALGRLALPPRVILLGSGFEYAAKDGLIIETDAVRPFSDYGASKAEACALVRQEGMSLPMTWVRLFNVYGPGEPEARLLPYLVSRAVQGLPIEVTAAEQRRDFTYVDDVAEGLMRLALRLPSDASWEIYNLGSGQDIRLRDFIEEAVTALRERGINPDVRFGAKPYRPGEPMKYLPDLSKLHRHLGWAPTTPLANGMRASVAALLRP
jgi:UDP-glucose 4-epimerase